MMERQTIKVDIIPGKGQVQRLNVAQGDIGRPLGVYITKNGNALDCSEYVADLYVLKPDGNYYVVNATVDSTTTNLIYWTTGEQETPVSGECEAQIRIMQDDEDIGTACFVEYVEESPGFCGAGSESVVESLMEYVRQAAASAEAAHAEVYKVDAMTASATSISSSSPPTAVVTDENDHKHIAFGIPAGVTPDISIGTVTTLNPDQPATATITGTISAPVLNLGIPRGQTGSIANAYASTIEYADNDSRTIKQVVDANKSALDKLAMQPSTTIPIPAAGGSASYDMSGITADYILISWGFSSSSENTPPTDLAWATYSGYFTITNNGSASNETIKPIFALPTSVAVSVHS